MVVLTKPTTTSNGWDTLPPLQIQHINGGIFVRHPRWEPTRSYACSLTERELEVLSLVAEGSSNAVIGALLIINERTVKNHLTHIMTKLDASDRTHAVVTAVRLGWLAI